MTDQRCDKMNVNNLDGGNAPRGDGNDRGARGVREEQERKEDSRADAAIRNDASSRDSEVAEEDFYGNGGDDMEEESDDEDAAEVASDDGNDGIIPEFDAGYLLGFFLPAMRCAEDLWIASMMLRMSALYGSTTIGNASALQRLFVHVGTPPASTTDLGRYRRDFPLLFRSFVYALERCHRIVSIDLQHANFGGDGQCHGTHMQAALTRPCNRTRTIWTGSSGRSCRTTRP